jgi:Domain of unknown function (DUF4192)
MDRTQHENDISTSLANFEAIVSRLGFWPLHSVVAQWFVQTNEIFVQRMDYPSEVSNSNSSSHDWLEEFLNPIRGYRPTSVEIWVSRPSTDTDFSQFLKAINEAVVELGISIISVSMVSPSHMRSIACSDCIGGHAWSPNLNLVSLAGSRAELESEFSYRPECGLSSKVVSIASQHSESGTNEWRDHEVVFLHQVVNTQEALTDSLIARVCTAFQDVRVRDTFLWDLAAGHTHSRSAAARLSLMLQHVTGDLVVPIATVAGICWWVSGNGAKANMCLDRANEGTHGYGLATLLHAALTAGLPPQFWVDSVMELNRHDCLHGTKTGGKVA